MTQLKICNKCGIEKPLTEYYKDKHHKFGVRYYCKECNNADSIKWQKNNNKRVNEIARRGYEKRKEKILDYSRKNRQMYNENCQRWRLNHKNQIYANNSLNNFLSKSNIKNSEFICAICGKQPIQKHHENYDLWFSFIPLCKQHHGITFRKENKIRRENT